jgi:hypothetical protein
MNYMHQLKAKTRKHERLWNFPDKEAVSGMRTAADIRKLVSY